MSVIILITFPISVDDAPSRVISCCADSISTTAWRATATASVALTEISRIDAPISSDPPATARTLSDTPSTLCPIEAIRPDAVVEAWFRT
jgi:hypothetical protein